MTAKHVLALVTVTEKQDAGEQHLTLCKRRHGLCVGAGAVQVDIEHAPVLQRRRQHTREHSHLDRVASALHGNYELMLCSHFISPFPDQRQSLKLPGIRNSGLPGVSPPIPSAITPARPKITSTISPWTFAEHTTPA